MDKYTITKNPEQAEPRRSFSDYTIVVEEVTKLGHLKFIEPLTIEVWIGDSIAHYEYDFGMEDECSIKKGHNFLFNYIGNNEENDPIKTVLSTIVFDLMHSFFHISMDPNYTHTHHALYGNLKDRVVAKEIDDDQDQTSNV